MLARATHRGMTTLFAKLAIPFPGLMAPFIAILELVVGINTFSLEDSPRKLQAPSARFVGFKAGGPHRNRISTEPLGTPICNGASLLARSPYHAEGSP